jgi:hypothetical protein
MGAKRPQRYGAAYLKKMKKKGPPIMLTVSKTLYVFSTKIMLRL